MHSIRRIIQSACKSLCIEGTGENNGIVTHSLRGTVASMLIQAGTPDSAITMRTGHRNTDSLKSYQNIRGKEGKTQQRIIFQSTNCEASQGERELSSRPSKTQRINTVEKKDVEEKCRIPADIVNPTPSDPTSESRYAIKEDNGSVADNVASVLRSVNASSIGSVNITVHYHDKKT